MGVRLGKGNETNNTQFVVCENDHFPQRGRFPLVAGQCFEWANRVRLSREFRSRGFMLNRKWVFNFIARRKLEPMDLQNEGFNVIE